MATKAKRLCGLQPYADIKCIPKAVRDRNFTIKINRNKAGFVQEEQMQTEAKIVFSKSNLAFGSVIRDPNTTVAAAETFLDQFRKDNGEDATAGLTITSYNLVNYCKTMSKISECAEACFDIMDYRYANEYAYLHTLWTSKEYYKNFSSFSSYVLRMLAEMRVDGYMEDGTLRYAMVDTMQNIAERIVKDIEIQAVCVEESKRNEKKNRNVNAQEKDVQAYNTRANYLLGVSSNGEVKKEEKVPDETIKKGRDLQRPLTEEEKKVGLATRIRLKLESLGAYIKNAAKKMIDTMPKWMKILLKVATFIGGILLGVIGIIKCAGAVKSWWGGSEDQCETESNRGAWRQNALQILAMMNKDANSELKDATNDQLLELVKMRALEMGILGKTIDDVDVLLSHNLPVISKSTKLGTAILTILELMPEEAFEDLPEDVARSISQDMDYKMEAMDYEWLQGLHRDLGDYLKRRLDYNFSIKPLVGDMLGDGCFTSVALANARDNAPLPVTVVHCEGSSGKRETSARSRFSKQQRIADLRVRMVKAVSQMASGEAYVVSESMVLLNRGGEGGGSIYAIPIGANKLLVPWHFFFDRLSDKMVVGDGDVIQITYKGLIYEERFQASSLNVIRTGPKKMPTDAVIYTTSSDIPSFKSLFKKFITKSDLVDCVEVPSAVFLYREGRFQLVDSGLAVQNVAEEQAVNGGQAIWNIGKRLLYNPVTQKGDCGCPVIRKDSFSRPIMGMHVSLRSCHATGESASMGLMFTQETLAKALKETKDNFRCELPDCDITVVDQAKQEDTPRGVFDVLGEVSVQDAIKLPNKTKYVCSTIHRECELNKELTFQPAVLKENDPRVEKRAQKAFGYRDVHPVVNAVEKYGKPIISFDARILEQATVYVTMKHDLFDHDVDRRVWSVWEAINGRTDLEYGSGLEMSTSEGYPWNKSRPKKFTSKKWLFSGEKPNLEIQHPPLKKAISDRILEGTHGRRVHSVWMECLKDECRETGKILLGKTRHFTCAPIDFTIVARMYLGSFCDFFYKLHRSNLYSAVGVNCYSNQWGQMDTFWKSVGDRGFAGDYKSFDGTVTPQEIDCVRDIVNHFYRKAKHFKAQEEVMRNVLFDEIKYTLCLARSTLYYVNRGNKSGVMMTVIINTIVNYVRHLYVWKRVSPSDMSLFTHFDLNVAVKIYGDDDKKGVSEKALLFFNGNAFKEVMAEFGIVYTNPNKLERNFKPEPLDKIAFLKCVTGYLRVGDAVEAVPLFDLEATNKTLNWVTKTLPCFEATNVNINSVLMKVAMYGRETFNKHACDLYMAYGRKRHPNGVLTIMLTYEEICEMFSLGTLDADGGEFYNGIIDPIRYMPGNSVRSERLEKTCPAPVVWVYEPQMKEPEEEVKSDPVEGQTEISEPEKHKPGTKLESMGAVREKIKVKTISKIAEGSVCEEDWSFSETSERWQFIKTFAMSVAQGPGTVLQGYSVPWDLLSAPIAALGFGAFTFWRGEVEVSLHVNATKFHCGQLIAYFVPLTNRAIIDAWHSNSRCCQSLMLHAMVDVSSDKGVNVKIPFVHPKQWLNSNFKDEDHESLGQLIVGVFNQLRVGQGSTSISITVYVSFKNPHFRVPRVITTNPVTTQGVVNSKVQNVNLDHVIGTNLPLDMQGDKLTNKTDVSSMDKPNIGIHPPEVVRRQFPMLASGFNIDYSEQLTLKANYATPATPDHFGCTEDEMSIRSMVTRRCFSHTLELQSDVHVNTMISSGYLEPTESMNNLRTHTTGCVPLLDMYSAPFAFWHGSLIYEFHAIISQLHTCKIAFCVHYGTDVIPDTFAEAARTYVVMQSINAECNVLKTTVPFKSAYPQLPIVVGQHTNRLKGAMGRWSLWLVNPVRMVDTISPVVDINVYRYAGKDFRTTYISPSGMSLVYTATDQMMSADMALGTARESVTAKDKVEDCAIPIYGEDYDSIQAICKRFTCIGTGTFNVAGPVGSFGKLAVIPISQLAGQASGRFEMALGRPWTCIFRVWRGSLRFKLLFNVPLNKNVLVAATFVPGEFADESGVVAAAMGSLPVATTNKSISNVPLAWVVAGKEAPFLEIQVPFVTNKNFIMRRSPSFTSEEFVNTGHLVLLADGNPGRIPYTMWSAGGDDFRFGIIWGLPFVQIADNSVTDHFTSKTVDTHEVTRSVRFIMEDGSTAINGNDFSGLLVGVISVEKHHQDNVSDWYTPTEFTIDIKDLHDAGHDDTIKKLFELPDTDNITIVDGETIRLRSLTYGDPPRKYKITGDTLRFLCVKNAGTGVFTDIIKKSWFEAKHATVTFGNKRVANMEAGTLIMPTCKLSDYVDYTESGPKIEHDAAFITIVNNLHGFEAADKWFRAKNVVSTREYMFQVDTWDVMETGTGTNGHNWDEVNAVGGNVECVVEWANDQVPVFANELSVYDKV